MPTFVGMFLTIGMSGGGVGAVVAQGSGAPAPAPLPPVFVSAFLTLSFNIFVNSVPSLPIFVGINLNPSMVRKIV